MGAQLLKILPGLLPKAVMQDARNTTRGLVENGRRFDEILQRTMIGKAGSKIDLKSIPPALLAILQSGMPLNTVVNQIAQTLTGKVASALGHGAQHAISEIAKNKLLQAFASALAPPGGSPPGSTAEQASALAEQLQQLVANIAGVAEAGQQNRFTGNLLDAITAKENPAQQQSEQPASKDAVVAPFVESVLRDAVSRLQASAIDTSGKPPGPSIGPVVPNNPEDVAQIVPSDPAGKLPGPSIGPVVPNNPEDVAQIVPSDPAGKPPGPSIGPVVPNNPEDVAQVVPSHPAGKSARPSTGPVVRDNSEDVVQIVPGDPAAKSARPSTGPVVRDNSEDVVQIAPGDPAAKSARPSTGPVVRNNAEVTIALEQLLKLPTPEANAKPGLDQPGSVLGRMLARAAGVDARINGNPNATAAAIASDARIKPMASQALPVATSQPVDPRASLENLVAAIVDATKNSGGNANGNSSGQNPGSFSWNLVQNAFAHISDGKAKPSTLDGSSFTSQANALLGGAFHTAASAAADGTASPGLTPYTTVDANSLIDQVVKGVIVRNFGENTSEIRMRLSPEHLGDVSLKLSVTGGNISASITAQNADVRDTLLANQNQLSKSLADAGLKLANFSVNVSGGGANAFAQQQQFAQQAGVRRIAFHIGNDEAQDDVLSAVPSFAPPQSVNAKLGLLNYLA